MAHEKIPAQSQADIEAAGGKDPNDLAETVGAAPGLGPGEVTLAHDDALSRLLPAFDSHRPPSRQLLDDCVHCGFCLPSCPTYLLFGEEMDSPRGRIYLMREGLDGEPMTESMVRHFDLCLGCLACQTACPSGVQYEKLIEATRPQIERRYPRPLPDRLLRTLIYSLFPYRRRLQRTVPLLRLFESSGLRALLRRSEVLRLLPHHLRAMEELLPPAPPTAPAIPADTPAQGAERARVAVLLGCVQGAFFPDVNAATVRVLAAEGCRVLAPSSQGCCGALSLHAGREEEAMRLARRTIDTFEATRSDYVAVNVAGCGSAMKEYGNLLRDDQLYADRAASFSARVRDVSELLEELGPIAHRHPLPLEVVYHDACHLAHGQGITVQPRDSLRRVPGISLHEVPAERVICCGSAGTWNLLQPEPARALGDRKAQNVAASGAQVLVTSNPGCLLQISAALRRTGISLPAVHTIQIIDAAIRGAGPEEFLRHR